MKYKNWYISSKLKYVGKWFYTHENSRYSEFWSICNGLIFIQREKNDDE